MKSLKDTLEVDLQARKDEAELLRDRIIMLWDLLHMPLQENELFLANNMGHTSSMIQSLKDELVKLEMQMLISRLREEIFMFWEKCLYGKTQTEAFQAYYTERYSEEILDQHESYLKSLKELHSECHVCFEKVLRLNELFEKLIAFVTKKDFNADRFNNRGGALLKEEKERKKVQMLIPKLVTEIKEAVRSWESEHDSHFSVFGKPFADYVQCQWETYEKEKENERTERQLLKARNMEEGAGLSSTMGSNKRPLAQMGTPLTTGRASKILRIFTPMTSTSRLAPMNRICTRSILRAPNTCNTPLGKPPLSALKTLPKQKIAPRRLHQRNVPARQRKLLNVSNAQPTFNPFVARKLDMTALLPSANASTYSDFQNKLSRKCGVDVNSQSSTMALGSPLLCTPRRLHNRMGLPLLM